MLAAAGARLARPALAASISHWKGDWESDRRTNLALEVRRREQDRASKSAAASGGAADQVMAEYKAKAEAELAFVKQAAQKELERELEMQRVALTGTTEEMIALQKQQEKEQRVEHLAQKAMKRICNQGVMRGFSAWSEQYLQDARHKRMLAAAGARLMRPALAASVSHWRNDWEAERRKNLAQEVRRRASAKYGGSANAEVAEIRATAEADLAAQKKFAEEDKLRALEKQRIELTGSVEEILALRAAEEKEKRVEQLAQKAMKRLSNQGIMRGFTAWSEQYLQAARQKRMLAAAGARIMRPGLAMAVSHWKGDWEEERRITLALTVQRRERARFGTAEQEVSEVRARAEADRAAAKERERAALEKQRVEMMGTAEERLAFEKEEQAAKRIDYLYKQSARRIMNQGLIRGWTAWHDEWYELTRQNRLLSGATARLAKPGLVASFKWLQHYTIVAKRNKLSGGWEQKLQMVQKAGEQLLKQERRAAAERRLELQAVIRDLERQINALGREVRRGPASYYPGRTAPTPCACRTAHPLALCAPHAGLLPHQVSMCCPIASRPRSPSRPPTPSRSFSTTSRPMASPTRTRREALTRIAVSLAWTMMGEHRPATPALTRSPSPRRPTTAPHRSLTHFGPRPDRTLSLVLTLTLALHASSPSSPRPRRPKRECAYTSYKPNSLHPSWTGERLQVGLHPGGMRPVRLLIEIWDKDIQTADDIIARAEIVLDNPKGDTLTLPLFAVEEGAEDVEAFTFTYEFQAEAERVQATKKASLTKSNRGSRPGSADKNSPAGLKGKLGKAAANAKGGR